MKLSTLEYPVADVLEWKRIVVCLYEIPKKERVLARRNKSNGMYSGKASEQCKIFVFLFLFSFSCVRMSPSKK